MNVRFADTIDLELMQEFVGWQVRWFKLEMPLGVLSYYRSEEEVGQASRGSLKMACCDIAG